MMPNILVQLRVEELFRSGYQLPHLGPHNLEQIVPKVWKQLVAASERKITLFKGGRDTVQLLLCTHVLVRQVPAKGEPGYEESPDSDSEDEETPMQYSKVPRPPGRPAWPDVDLTIASCSISHCNDHRCKDARCNESRCNNSHEHLYKSAKPLDCIAVMRWNHDPTKPCREGHLRDFYEASQTLINGHHAQAEKTFEFLIGEAWGLTEHRGHSDHGWPLGVLSRVYEAEVLVVFDDFMTDISAWRRVLKRMKKNANIILYTQNDIKNQAVCTSRDTLLEAVTNPGTTGHKALDTLVAEWINREVDRRVDAMTKKIWEEEGSKDSEESDNSWESIDE